MLVSYDAVATAGLHRSVFEEIVPSALIDYDLPDLAAAVAPRPLWISGLVSPVGAPLVPSELETNYRSAARAFELAGAADKFRLKPSRSEEENAGHYYGELFRI